MNVDGNAAIRLKRKFYRLDMRIDHLPLASPIRSNFSVTMDLAAFHSVRRRSHPRASAAARPQSHAH